MTSDPVKPRLTLNERALIRRARKAIDQTLEEVGHTPTSSLVPWEWLKTSSLKQQADALGVSMATAAQLQRVMNWMQSSPQFDAEQLDRLLDGASERSLEEVDLSSVQRLADEAKPIIDGAVESSQPDEERLSNTQPRSKIEVMAYFLFSSVLAVMVDRGIPPTEEMTQWLAAVAIYVAQHLY